MLELCLLLILLHFDRLSFKLIFKFVLGNGRLKSIFGVAVAWTQEPTNLIYF